MNRRMITYMLGRILIVEAFLMIPSVICGLIYKENIALTFLVPMAILIACGLPMCWKKPKNTAIYARDGFFIVAAAWVLMCLTGALPFIFSGEFEDVWTCIFEITSGFTTTGSTALAEVESLSKSILFWRSFSHWIGGMGVLVFVLAILPQSDDRSLYLMRAEVPGPVAGKLVPKMKDTAKILYAVYTAMTLILAILLIIGKMPVFDSLCHAFGTAGTGGFSVKNASIGAYDSVYIEMVIAVFMLLFGINFNLFYLILIGRAKEAFKSEELRWYLAIIGISTAAIAINIYRTFNSVGQSLRYSFFQVCTVVSSTGYSTTNFTDPGIFPYLAQHILFMLMLVGACAGSTGGGFKLSRVIILLKSFVQEVKKLFHPRAVAVVRLEGKAIDSTMFKGVLTYLSMFIVMICSSTLLISFNGYDFTTNVTAVITCFNNMGPTLGDTIGATGNFSIFNPFCKMVLSLDMLFGRLEIFPMLVLFTPSAWKIRNS